MFRFWTRTLLTGLLLSSVVMGQTTRSPASYMPDDDIIAKPMDNKISFYQQHIAADKSFVVVESRNQLKIWNDNQLFADQYGYDSTLAGSRFVPTSKEKWEYFKDRYMRYLRRKGEEPLKEMPKTWYREYRTSNEVDAIDEMEDRFRKSNRIGGVALPEALQQKEVNVWKETKFIFQPRVDRGLIIVGIRGPIAYARAWVGINGRTEVNIQKDIESIGFRAMYNYEADTGRNFASLDQKIVDNLYARATILKNPMNDIDDDSLMLLYAAQF
jgi:hypothetical protein